MALNLRKLSFEEIKVGDTAFFEKEVDDSLVRQFADLSGDYNPLHMDESYAANTPFGGRMAHGMLLGSFFSALVGMLCPGERSLYLSQTLNFKQPAKIGAKVRVEGKVSAKSDALKVITMATIIQDASGTVLIEGEARVKVL